MLAPTEDWNQREFELEGVPVKLRAYRIDKSYVAELESASTGCIIARAIACTPEEAERAVIDTATRRLFRTAPIDPSLTVGG